MKSYLAATLFLLVGSASAQDLKRFEFTPPAASRDTPTQCAFSSVALPADLRVYAAGSYSGRKLARQIDQSGHEATQFDLAVNSPDHPVALLLGAYEPTIWNIGWTRTTHIVAVFVSGYHRQVVAGLGDRVPVLASTYDNKGPCGYVYIGKNDNAALNPLSRRLFGKPVDMVYPGGRDGRVVVGAALPANADLVTSATRTPEKLFDPKAPLAGQAGLDAAVAQGVLRHATAADADAWVTARAENAPPRDVPPIAGVGQPKSPRPGLYHAYVVLKAFTYPAGLYGANAATFFVPRGTPRPTGNPGHSAVYDFESLSCVGALCGVGK